MCYFYIFCSVFLKKKKIQKMKRTRDPLVMGSLQLQYSDLQLKINMGHIGEIRHLSLTPTPLLSVLLLEPHPSSNLATHFDLSCTSVKFHDCILHCRHTIRLSKSVNRQTETPGRTLLIAAVEALTTIGVTGTIFRHDDTRHTRRPTKSNNTSFNTLTPGLAKDNY